MKKEITRKNEQQLNYIYGEETVNVLKDAMKKAINSGNYTTINIDDLDKLNHKHVVIAKIKLWFKSLFK